MTLLISRLRSLDFDFLSSLKGCLASVSGLRSSVKDGES